MIDDSLAVNEHPEKNSDINGIRMAAKRRSYNNATANGIGPDLESGNGKLSTSYGSRSPQYGLEPSSSSSPSMSLKGSIRGSGGGGGETGGMIATGPSKKKRALAYAALFLLLLIMSALLDMRREVSKAGRKKREKMQLQMPSGGVGVGVDASVERRKENDAGASVSGEDIAKKDNKDRREGLVAVDAHEGVDKNDIKTEEKKSSSVGISGELSDAHDDSTEEKRTIISEQELKDDVDQLIEHVAKEQEEEQENKGENNSTTTVQKSDAGEVSGNRKSKEIANDKMLIQNGTQSNPLNETSVQRPEAETIEEVFEKSQSKIKSWLLTETIRKMIDEHALRFLQALALQATRGDCEQASGEDGGSLFKTDAEAASNEDIERTEPLWGAWCIIKGTYKSDAMRDYVRKEKLLSSRLEVVLNRTMVDGKVVEGDDVKDINSVAIAPLTSGSDTAPNDTKIVDQAPIEELSEYLGEERSMSLRKDVAYLVPHLTDMEVRYLAALGIQATNGDCTKNERREWRETVVGLTREKQRGALWGAWCVLRGKSRQNAADDLRRRVELLLAQKKKLEENDSVNSGGEQPDSPQNLRGVVSSVEEE